MKPTTIKIKNMLDKELSKTDSDLDCLRHKKLSLMINYFYSLELLSLDEKKRYQFLLNNKYSTVIFSRSYWERQIMEAKTDLENLKMKEEKSIYEI